MVVVTIIGIMTAMIIPEMKGTFQDALLRASSRELVNVFDLAYSRAVSLNQERRVRLDEATGRYEVVRPAMVDGREIFVPADDVPECQGQLDPRIAMVLTPPEMAEPAGPAAPAPAPASGTDSTTPAGVEIAFYPDGTADPAEVQLRDREGFRLRLRINPITARVHVVRLEPEPRS